MMSDAPDAPPTSLDATPPSRATRQRRTREALLEAAYRTFARDGYHGASLEAIAHQAGYSKGAVYSNFTGKGELFLAVMDRMLLRARDEAWGPADRAISREELDAVADLRFDDPPTAAQLSRGFGLATLEFASSAGRDADLAAGLREQLAVLVDAYTRSTASDRVGDPLDDAALGFLLAAFDQGFALFALLGWPIDDPTLLHQGLQRLQQPPSDDRD